MGKQLLFNNELQIFHENVETTEWFLIVCNHSHSFGTRSRICQKSGAIFRVEWRMVKLVCILWDFIIFLQKEKKISKTRLVTMYMLSVRCSVMAHGKMVFHRWIISELLILKRLIYFDLKRLWPTLCGR